MICHIVLLCILILIRAFNTFAIISGNMINEEAKGWFDASVRIGVFGALNFATVLALIFCFIYCWKGYSKSAAGFYKSFLVLTAAGSALSIAVVAIANTLGMGLVKAMVPAVAIMAVKIILLLILAFAKDLGKKNTEIVFWVLLVLDLLFGFMFADVSSVRLYRVGVVVSRLLVDGTIGLSIRGKYKDKEARGAAV